jgi:hypothetical protein
MRDAATPPPYPDPMTTTSYEERSSSTGLERRGKGWDSLRPSV